MSELTIEQASSLAPTVTAQQAAAKVAGGALLIDVRSEGGRTANGPLPGAQVVGKDEVEKKFGLDSAAPEFGEVALALLQRAAVVAFGSSIIEWAGIEESESEMVKHGQWLADIVDGFGVVGPAYVKAAEQYATTG